MFIRKTPKKDRKTQKTYNSYQLVESIRTERGPRQRVLLNLGTNLDLDSQEKKQLSNRIEEIISGQDPLFQYETKIEKLAQTYASRLIHNLSKPTLESKNTAIVPDYTSIDLNSLSHEKARTIGTEHLLYQAAQQLKIPEKLKNLGLEPRQIKIALASIIARGSFPASERATLSQLQENSALGELLDMDFQRISLNPFYKISDILLKHKEALETHIAKKQKNLYGVQDTLILYDLTNTYFEGKTAANPKGKFGKSKEKRTDCPLVTIGLVLNQHGFLTRSQFLEGNISEPKTLQSAIEVLHSSNDLLKPSIAMDAGIATEENLRWLNDHGYTYVVCSRGKAPKGNLAEEEFAVGKNKDNPVKVREFLAKDQHEKWVCCESPAKEAKAREMKVGFQKRFEEDLKNARAALAKPRGIKKFEKVLERIGRLKEKHRKISSCYQVEVIPCEEGKFAKEIQWNLLDEKIETKLTGTYYLRSNLLDKNAEELWNLYHMLQHVENAFRFMKSSLGMRPIYHQKEKRVDGHLWITILAYSLIHDILHRLKAGGLSYSWGTVRTCLSNRVRVTTSAKTKDNKQFYFRSTTKPEPVHLCIYNALGISSEILGTSKIFF